MDNRAQENRVKIWGNILLLYQCKKIWGILTMKRKKNEDGNQNLSSAVPSVSTTFLIHDYLIRKDDNRKSNIFSSALHFC